MLSAGPGTMDAWSARQLRHRWDLSHLWTNGDEAETPWPIHRQLSSNITIEEPDSREADPGPQNEPLPFRCLHSYRLPEPCASGDRALRR